MRGFFFPMSDICYYNETEFSELLSKPKEEVKSILIEQIKNGIIEYPLKDISETDMISSFKSLCDYSPKSFEHSHDVFSRYPYAYPLSGDYIDEGSQFNDCSNFFHQEARWKCDSINAPSPYRTWYTEKFLDTLLNCIWTLKFKELWKSDFRSMISLRKYIASQFKPNVAKSIYSHFNSKRVLDFSSGWGDRLAGFCATTDTEFYFGIDPNHAVQEGYKKQIDAYNVNKSFELVESPAEDVDIPENEFDTVYTSPPYFNVERYTQDGNQSWKKYKKLDKWLNEFLFVVLEKAWNGLKKDGHMIINISDVYSGHQVNKICDPMNDFIKELGGTYINGMGMKMAKRPNSKSHKDGVFVEPVWIWRK